MVVIVPFVNGRRHEVIKTYTSTKNKTTEEQTHAVAVDLV